MTENTTDLEAGVGWYEWFKAPANTSHIAYAHEGGDVYDPENGWNPPEFLLAATEGRVHKLVRADEPRPYTDIELEAQQAKLAAALECLWDHAHYSHDDRLDDLSRILSDAPSETDAEDE
jgi:hypothetical protein